jgi:hypothetical protein
MTVRELINRLAVYPGHWEVSEVEGVKHLRRVETTVNGRPVTFSVDPEQCQDRDAEDVVVIW